jgi:hypothetical protein
MNMLDYLRGTMTTRRGIQSCQRLCSEIRVEVNRQGVGAVLKMPKLELWSSEMGYASPASAWRRVSPPQASSLEAMPKSR